jgi:hypothetical protein
VLVSKFEPTGLIGFAGDVEPTAVEQPVAHFIVLLGS